MKSTLVHPSWCQADYRCTAEFATGEHRSEPIVIARAGHRIALVVSLVQRVDRPSPRVEIRLSIRLRATTAPGQVAEVTHLLYRLARLIPGGAR